jgi:type VI secretion system protein ImpA
MPLRNDLLNPISAAKPAGDNLRYAPVYDKIKEARRQDDDLAQGEWVRERKVADWPLAIKLISESLATKSKDLQLVAWLAEAMLRKEGIAGFREVLNLAKAMLEKFWDDLYPELEEGDAEMRAVPLQWIGDRMEIPIKQIGLTRKGLNWYQYKESRTLGDEKSANNDQKKKEREKAIKAGKIPLEVFDKEFDESPKKFYVDLLANFDGTLESLTELGEFGDSKFGGNSPTYGALRNALEEVRQTIYILLQKKREKEPDEPPPPPPPTPEEIAAAEAAAKAAAAAAAAAAAPPPPPPPPAPPVSTSAGGAAAAAAPAPVASAAPPPVAGIAADPANVEDAVSRLLAVAKYLREKDKTNPAPYLMAAGFRWGELRAKGANADQSLLAAPSGEIRQNLKKLAMEGKWADLIDAAQAAAATESGRGWLDVHRYIARACEKIGGSHQPLKQAVVSGVRTLLADYPKLTEMTLMDDTPTANAETMEWLKEQVIPPPPPPAAPPPPPEPVIAAPVRASSNGEPGAPDVFEIAQLAVKKGRPQEGIELLMREMTQERSGRGRFQRKSQLAQICVATGHQMIAFPILQDLAGEIERRKLEDWETPEMVAHPLALLYKCLAQDASNEERQRLYSWICRLDPLQALNVSK